jgi:two-component sensor histidine kinase
MLENNNYIDLRIFSASILLLLLLFFIMGFGLLIYYNLQLKKNIVRLNSMNNSFQVSITRKDLQLKDLHHRIKNNLQLIISLLNIEASKKNGDTIDEYLLKGQSRIHSIAAMHQNLYETEYYESIKLQNYIESIVRNMTNIYNNNIKIEINTNAVSYTHLRAHETN